MTDQKPGAEIRHRFEPTRKDGRCQHYLSGDPISEYAWCGQPRSAHPEAVEAAPVIDLASVERWLIARVEGLGTPPSDCDILLARYVEQKQAEREVHWRAQVEKLTAELLETKGLVDLAQKVHKGAEERTEQYMHDRMAAEAARDAALKSERELREELSAHQRDYLSDAQRIGILRATAEKLVEALGPDVHAAYIGSDNQYGIDCRCGTTHCRKRAALAEAEKTLGGGD